MEKTKTRVHKSDDSGHHHAHQGTSKGKTRYLKPKR